MKTAEASPDTVISVKGASKTFKLPHEKTASLKTLLINFRKRRTYEHQRALKTVSFDIKRGEFFGIVGRNGSGKSTLLKMLAGIYTPTAGSIHINGTLTPFIELGVGFNPELTGRENVFLNGALLGFGRKEMQAMYTEIVDFAELEKFMDQKLKNYSSGMQVRLAFSIAIRAKSDILLIDEVLAVGDAAFQTKCFDYFFELKKKGTTVVFVSHDRGSLERFCERGILIDKGIITAEGKIQEVLRKYTEVVMQELEHNLPTSNAATGQEAAAKYAVIENVSVLGADNKAKKRFTYGQDITIRVEAVIKRDITNPIFGVIVRKKNLDSAVYASNTMIEGNKATGTFAAGERVTFELQLPRLLNDGEYHIEPAIANESGTVFFDQRQNAASFIINGSNNPFSIINSTTMISVKRSH